MIYLWKQIQQNKPIHSYIFACLVMDFFFNDAFVNGNDGGWEDGEGDFSIYNTETI